MNFRPAYVGAVAAVLAIVVSAAFWIAGSVVVHDNGGAGEKGFGMQMERFIAPG